MIKIISGWSNPGGSTTSWINLTNALNKRNFPTVFYGPHEFHLDKCVGDRLSNFVCMEDDYLVVHFFNVPSKQKVKKFIFSSHEQNILPIRNINYHIYDAIHYVSEHQRLYHNIDFPYRVIPNVVEDLNVCKLKPYLVAGIIGSIDKNKNVDVSIQRALDDGMEKILIYGLVTDSNHWNNDVLPLIEKYPSKIYYMGYQKDKQKMFDSISHCYNSSSMETWGYLVPECEKTGTVFCGNGVMGNNIQIDDTDTIVKSWIEFLEVDA